MADQESSITGSSSNNRNNKEAKKTKMVLVDRESIDKFTRITGLPSPTAVQKISERGGHVDDALDDFYEADEIASIYTQNLLLTQDTITNAPRNDVMRINVPNETDDIDDDPELELAIYLSLLTFEQEKKDSGQEKIEELSSCSGK